MTLNWRPYIPHALGGLSLACLTMFGYQTWRARDFERARDRATERAASAVHFADSVKAVNDSLGKQIASLMRSADALNREATAWRQRAQASEGVLLRLSVSRKQLSDSLQLITTAKDSLPVLVRLVTNLTTENSNLRAGLHDALRADSLRQLVVDSLNRVHVIDSLRYVSSEASHDTTRGALRESQKALAKAQAPCDWLPFVKCPSRKAVAIVSVAASAAVTYKLTKKPKR